MNLLILQFSGAHVHVDAAGYVGVPETSYSHSHGHAHFEGGDAPDAGGHHGADRAQDSGNDYGGAEDVSLLDQALTAFKIPMAILTLVFLFALVAPARTLAGADIVYPVLSGRHTRWRPPLRAPPRTA